MDSLESLDFSSFIIVSDDPWSLLVSFCQLFKLPLVVQSCNVICEWPLKAKEKFRTEYHFRYFVSSINAQFGNTAHAKWFAARCPNWCFLLDFISLSLGNFIWKILWPPSSLRINPPPCCLYSLPYINLQILYQLASLKSWPRSRENLKF